MSTGEWVVGGHSCSLFPASQSTIAVLRWLLRWSGLRTSRCDWLRSCKQTVLGGEEAACGLSSQQVEWNVALRGASSTMM